jgi:Acetyltransferase (GNAT) domain
MRLRQLLEFDVDDLRSKYTNDGDHRIDVFNNSGAVGYIEWDSSDGEVIKIFVGKPYRRQGVATHLWELATEWAENNNELPPEHSSRRSKEGDEFAKSIGGYIPDLTDDIDGWSSRVDELKNTKFEISVNNDTPYVYDSDAYIDGHLVNFRAEQESDGLPWTVEFTTDFSLDRVDMGTASIKVASFVLQALDAFISKRQPCKISFASEAKDSARVNVYKKQAFRLAKKYGYKVDEQPYYRGDKYVQFMLVKKY